MKRNYPNIPFERYADDTVLHCKTLKQAKFILNQVQIRLRICKLELHPQKTKIVYCQDDDRPLEYEGETSFDFLGYTFGKTMICDRTGRFQFNFLASASKNSCRDFRRKIRDLRAKQDRKAAESLFDTFDGRAFVAKTVGMRTLCSDVCRRVQGRENKRRHDERAKGVSYERAAKTAYMYWYNKMVKLRGMGLTREKMDEAEGLFQSYMDEAARRRKQNSKHKPDCAVCVSISFPVLPIFSAHAQCHIQSHEYIYILFISVLYNKRIDIA
jgi:hypothetical protein